MVIDPRLGARQCQDGHIYTKIRYLSARRIRLFELMCTTQFLTGAHNVIIDEFKGNWYTTMENFIAKQRTGEYEFRKKGYQRLHKEMDGVNAAVHRASWFDQHTTYRTDRVLGPPPPLPNS
jgi:hypothetical protein